MTAAYAAAAFAWNTLDYMNPWHHGMASTSDLDENFHHTEPEPVNYLFPHP
jgi:hypothetical protein